MKHISLERDYQGSVEDFASWLNDPEVINYTRRNTKVSLKEAETILHSQQNDKDKIFFYVSTATTPIGS